MKSFLTWFACTTASGVWQEKRWPSYKSKVEDLLDKGIQQEEDSAR